MPSLPVPSQVPHVRRTSLLPPHVGHIDMVPFWNMLASARKTFRPSR
jgi:hypothetical protein